MAGGGRADGPGGRRRGGRPGGAVPDRTGLALHPDGAQRAGAAAPVRPGPGRGGGVAAGALAHQGLRDRPVHRNRPGRRHPQAGPGALRRLRARRAPRGHGRRLAGRRTVPRRGAAARRLHGLRAGGREVAGPRPRSGARDAPGRPGLPGGLAAGDGAVHAQAGRRLPRGVRGGGRPARRQAPQRAERRRAAARCVPAALLGVDRSAPEPSRRPVRRPRAPAALDCRRVRTG